MHFIYSTHKNKHLFLFFIFLNISICSIFTQNKFDETDKKFENIKTSVSEKQKEIYEQIENNEDGIKENAREKTPFQEELYRRTFDTIQKVEKIDNKYRKLIEKIFAFLYRKIDLNLI